MREAIRCPECRGILFGQAQHSADMPCTCWMQRDEKRTMSDKTDAEILRDLADSMAIKGSHLPYVVADLRRIADRLERLEKMPTDEEINANARTVYKELYPQQSTFHVFMWEDGAKWMRDKIQGNDRQ